VHPHGAKEYTASTGGELAALWADERVVAVGECGLDYDRMFSPKEAQRLAFEAQIQASVRLAKPLFLHCRDAFDDFHAMLREAANAGAHGVVHCFTDGATEAEALLALGFDIGITGWVTDVARGGALRDALRVIPLDRLHLETDAPYLRPKNAGKTRPYNEPALLPFVAQAVAELKGVDVAAVAAQATRNSARLFRLPSGNPPGGQGNPQ
jgi:TatD DNase family protein